MTAPSTPAMPQPSTGEKGLHPIMAEALAPFIKPRTNCFGIPDTYRGWTISQDCTGQFVGTGPNFDASYEGPEDGWVSNGEQVSAPTWDALRDEIDEYLAGEAA